MNTINVLTNFYRTVIGPTMSGIYVELNPLIKMIMNAGGDGKISLEGEEIIFTQGGYYQGFSDARPRPGETGRTYNHQIVRGKVQPEQCTMRWEVTTETLLWNNQDQGEKYADYLSILAERWIRGWKDSHTIDCYGDATSHLATILTVGVAGPNSIEITEPQVFRKLPEDMYLDIGLEVDFQTGNDAAIHRARVTEQISETVFVVDNIGPVVAGMSIKRELRRNGQVYSPIAQNDTYYRTFHGLKSNMALSGNLWGLNRSLTKFRPIDYQATAATGLIYDDLLDINTKAEHRGVRVSDFFLPLDQYNTLLKRITNDILVNTKGEAFMKPDSGYREGIAHVEFLVSNKLCRLYTDLLLEKDKAYALDPTTWRSYVAANGIIGYDNGSPRIVNFGDELTGNTLIYDPSKPHAHAIEAYFAGQYACVQPKDNVVVEFI